MVPGSFQPEEFNMEKSRKERERRDGLWKDPESGIWRYRFMFRRKRYFGSCPEAKTKSEARAARDRRRIAVREGREEKAEAGINFKAFVKETFLLHVEINMAATTHINYKSRSGQLIKTFGPLDLQQITTFAVEKFKRAELARITRRGKTQSAAAVNGLLLALGSIFTLAEKLGKIEKGVRPKISLLKTDNRRLRYLSTEEEERLLAAAAARIYLEDLIVVALATGLRKDELFSLRREDVDLRLNLLNVLDGKGGKARSIPLDPAG